MRTKGLLRAVRCKKTTEEENGSGSRKRCNFMYRFLVLKAFHRRGILRKNVKEIRGHHL